MTVIWYRSLAGDLWPARLLDIHDDGTLALDVDGLELSRVTVHLGAAGDCPAGQCVENPMAMAATQLRTAHRMEGLGQ